MAAELALGSALAAIGAGVAVGFAALGSGIGQGLSLIHISEPTRPSP